MSLLITEIGCFHVLSIHVYKHHIHGNINRKAREYKQWSSPFPRESRIFQNKFCCQMVLYILPLVHESTWLKCVATSWDSACHGMTNGGMPPCKGPVPISYGGLKHGTRRCSCWLSGPSYCQGSEWNFLQIHVHSHRRPQRDILRLILVYSAHFDRVIMHQGGGGIA